MSVFTSHMNCIGKNSKFSCTAYAVHLICSSFRCNSYGPWTPTKCDSMLLKISPCDRLYKQTTHFINTTWKKTNADPIYMYKDGSSTHEGCVVYAIALHYLKEWGKQDNNCFQKGFCYMLLCCAPSLDKNCHEILSIFHELIVFVIILFLRYTFTAHHISTSWGIWLL